MTRNLVVFFVLISFVTKAQKGMFIIIRDSKMRPASESINVSLDWKELKKHGIVPTTGDFDIIDANFGKKVEKVLTGTDSILRVDFSHKFQSDEPIFSFIVQPNGKALDPIQPVSKVTTDAKLTITYLDSYGVFKSKGSEVKNWPDKIIESTMSFYPDPSVLPIYAPGNYSYEYAFFLHALFQRYMETKQPEYLAYLRRWSEKYFDSHGAMNPKHYNVNEYRLDDMLPGRLFISLYEVTKDSRYKNAAKQLRQQLQYQPRTADGGYWHKQIYPYQMWLDGVYMADIFTMQYAKAFNEPSLFKESMQQIRLIHEHNGDKTTGLLYHGWDESGNDVWANEETGASPEFWSRGIGWYLMALLECIEYIPLESPDRKELGLLFRELAASVIKYQDAKTGLWYQVTNKGYEPRNWFETSGSAMFAYALAKGHRKGILDKRYLDAAQKAFNTMASEYIFFDEQGRIYMDGTVKIGTLNTKTSKGDLDYYVTTERRVNDYKGLGALLLLAQELD